MPSLRSKVRATVISQPLDVQRQLRATQTIIWVVSSRGRLTRDPEFMVKLVAAGAEVAFCDLLLTLPTSFTRARGFGAELARLRSAGDPRGSKVAE
jgi:hypothetical protein